MHLFVYGTLRKAYSSRASSLHHKFLSDAIFCGTASIKGYLYLLGHYPGLVPDENSPTHVQGEIYQINKKILATLDEYEEIDPDKTDNEYQRINRIVTNGHGENFSAWVYVMNQQPEGQQLIVSGDWCK